MSVPGGLSHRAGPVGAREEGEVQQMRLTPSDVRNVAFKKPPLGKRGYDEDEVDAFLELVEQELTRLGEENAHLSERVSSLEESVAGAQAATGDRESPSARAIKIIDHAEAVADRVTSDAQEEAESLLTRAREETKAMTTEARDKSEAMVTDAREKADLIVSRATEKAEALRAESEKEHADLLASVAEQRTTLEGRINQLRTFEREYRVRLKAYLEAQLEDLTSSGAPAQQGRGASADQQDRDATEAPGEAPGLVNNAS
ncbi:DivIVA domain-containing protein [Lolliginicoccus suaedae]|uniref:DivIVA domain-containing protein n=1 Tax=Lolliginicoccus suaedae TaxID=2605429 RepID=UPI001F2EEE63|nr:DivIVA domain-containing protein [Lolliginicoccus suaedae]